jgi:selenium metabolism protein YedF
MKIIDVKGQQCPKPLIETKKALKELNKDEALKIVLDNPNSKNNVIKYLGDNDLEAEVRQQGEVFEIIVNNAAEFNEEIDAAAYCKTDADKDKGYIFVFAKDRIGEGDEALGKKLAGSFLETMWEMEEHPATIIFLNSGIHLCTKDSPYLDALKSLEKLGIGILICGTCVEYYNKQDEIAIGEISNAYTILTSITQAGKVINL